jgi:hypothetical protein
MKELWLYIRRLVVEKFEDIACRLSYFSLAMVFGSDEVAGGG